MNVPHNGGPINGPPSQTENKIMRHGRPNNAETAAGGSVAVTGYTAGPWWVTASPWDNSGMLVHSSEDPHGGKFIADLSQMEWADPDDYDPDEAQANARLIAAAPNLFEALAKLRDEADVHAWIEESGQRGWGLADALCAAEAALKMARGEAV